MSEDSCNRIKETSDAIGSTPAGIERLIRGSNEKKFLFHGIKRAQFLDDIKKEGIKPLTPECGFCSFWSSGLALFYPMLDSPFFLYSGPNLMGSPDVCRLNLAMTSHSLLSDKGYDLPPFRKDGQLQIYETISSEDIVLLNIRLKHPLSDDRTVSRRYMRDAEKMLLAAIEKQVYEGFTPGRYIEHYEEV